MVYTTRDIDKDLSFEFCDTTLTLAVSESEENILQFKLCLEVLKRKRLTIIYDAAGSGKKTILTRFCHLLKRKKPSVLVERFDLSNLIVMEKIDELSEYMNDGDVEEFLEFVAKVSKVSKVSRYLTKKLFH